MKITLPQRKYYWDVVIPAYMKILGGDKYETHEWIKREFKIRSLSNVNGISTKEFADKLLEMQELAARLFDVYIKDPNETKTM
jgi:hypothetical protein